MFSRIKRWAVIAVICLFTLLITGCLEADCDLAVDSRLPVGLLIPSGLSRADVLINVHEYTNRAVKFVVRSKKGKILTTMTGRAQSGVLYLQSAPLGPGPKFPNYSLVTINGKTEILEQKRKESIVYITDDPQVREELLGRVQ